MSNQDVNSSADDKWKKDLDDEAEKLFWRCMEKKGYEMGSYLGKGRSCMVLRAWSVDDENNVAVKVIDKLKVKSQYYEEKLPKELSIWQKMCHPNIIRLLDHTSDTRWTYSIMEYFPGGDLDDWLLTNDKVGPELSRHWLFQLVSALRHLKKLGYAHGDVKPKNVLVVGEKLLKLCDFGCMKPLNEGLSTSFCGSFGYVAPEIFRKEPHDPEKADVWSYGVTAYKLVTHGQIACTCSSYVHKLRKNWLNTLPLESQSFFLAIFQRRPEKRMTLDEIFNHDWIRDDTENVRHAKKPYGSKKAISSARSGQTSGGVKAVKECLKMVDGCQYLTPGFVYPSDVLPLKRRRPNFMKCVHNAHGGLWSAMKPREEITDKIP